MPLISVIIPVYNTEKYLKQCLDSAVNQTLADIEIICVNDCSPDNSLEILKEYASKDNRIKVIDNKINLGQGKNRNAALNIATGDYIMFLDCDDWLEENACKDAYNQITENKNDFVVFEAINHFENKNTTQKSNRLKKFENIKNNKSATVFDIKKHFLGNSECWYKIYNKKFLLQNNILFSEEKYEDGIFNLKLFIYAKSISILDKPLYHYRIRAGSTATTVKNYIELIKRSRECLKFIEDNPIPNKEFFIQNKLIHTIRILLNHFNKAMLIDKSGAINFYKEIRTFFCYLKNNYDISAIKKEINYKKYNRIIKYNFFTYEFFEILSNIFSIQSEIKNGTKRKIITFFGIKFKIKKQEDNNATN